MKIRHILLIMLMCLCWGLHFSVVKSALDYFPPIFYAALRMGLVSLLLLPFLRWHKGRMRSVIAGAMCFGFFNYLLLFVGIRFATPSTTGIAVELGIPFSLALSALLLKEDVGWRRWSGVVVAFIGVTIIAFDHGTPSLGFGIALIAGAAFAEALGGTIVHRIRAVKPMELLSWFALVGCVCLGASSLLLEQDPLVNVEDHWRLLLWSIAYSAVVASLFGHGCYYHLLQILPVSHVTPLFLMSSFFAVLFGVLLHGDRLSANILVGGALTLLGVGYIAYRNIVRRKHLPAVAPASVDVGVGLTSAQIRKRLLKEKS